MASESIHGRIYKIISSETDSVYVGSTTQTLKDRLSCHKADYKRYIQGHHMYVTSFDIVKFSDARIELLQEDLFSSKADLHRLEGQYMQTTENCINRCIAGRTRQEYEEKHRDRINEYARQYRLNNSEKICQTAKRYYDNHRELTVQRNKDYRENNKDKIKERKTQIILCPVCEQTFTHCNRARHERTKKHQYALSQTSSTELHNESSTNE